MGLSTDATGATAGPCGLNALPSPMRSLAWFIVLLMATTAAWPSTAWPSTPPGPASPTPASEPAGPLNRRLLFLAFADDGSSAMLLERSGTVIITEAVWIVDAKGVREVLSLGPVPTRATMGGSMSGTISGTISGTVGVNDDCRRSAEKLAAMARDYELISVKVGLCAQPNREVVASLKTRGPAVVSAAVGRLHQQVGFAGRTFIADRRGVGVDAGALVVVIGEDIFGNDRVGVTLQRR